MALTASSLTGCILEKISEFGLSIQNCIAESYNGAAVMGRHISGVQTRIREVSQWEIYVHYYVHRLIYSFISGSYVHTAWLNLQETMYSTERPIESKALSDNKWTSQTSACNAETFPLFNGAYGKHHRGIEH